MVSDVGEGLSACRLWSSPPSQVLYPPPSFPGPSSSLPQPSGPSLDPAPREPWLRRKRWGVSRENPSDPLFTVCENSVQLFQQLAFVVREGEYFRRAAILLSLRHGPFPPASPWQKGSLHPEGLASLAVWLAAGERPHHSPEGRGEEADLRLPLLSVKPQLSRGPQDPQDLATVYFAA